MAEQHFFVEGRYLGSRPIPNNRMIPGLPIKRHDSIVYFCIRCGDIWARFLHDGAELTQCQHRPCARHGDGQLSWVHDFHGYDMMYFEENWPPAAVQYEFERFLDYASKG